MGNMVRGRYNPTEDHGDLDGLTDNDHTQYVNAVTDTATINLTLTGQSVSGAVIAGGVDHGSLAGLGDDDHTQYLLANGSRALAGAWNMGSQALTNVNVDSGTLNGITALVVANNVDIGNFTLTANGLTIDGTFTDGTLSIAGGSIAAAVDISLTGDLTIPDDGLFAATNTANYIWMADGINYAPTSPADARTGLGLVIGTNVQAWDAQLDDIAALAVTDGNFIVGNGSNWVAESGNTARTSLGLGTGDSPTWVGATLSGFTQGSVIFAGAGGVLSEDNTNFFWEDTGNALRIKRLLAGGVF